MTSDLVQMVREAKDVVEGAGLDIDSPAGVATLSVLLERSLNNGPRASEANSAEETKGDPRHRVATAAGVDASALDDFFVFEDAEGGVEVPARLLPQSRAERQRRLALLKLALDRIGYGIEEVSVRHILSLCDRYGCLDKNLSRNLESFGNRIVRRGAGSSASYRLTQPGLDAAKEILTGLLANG